MKKTTIVALSAMLIIAGMYVYFFNDALTTPTQDVPETQSDFKNISYEIEGVTYELKDGVAHVPSAPDSSAMNTLSLYGDAIKADLDNDGDEDAALTLVLTTAGTGTFYYAVLALQTSYGFKSTNALLLGDRITPQVTEVVDGHAIYNFISRPENAAMTDVPSVAQSIRIQLDPKKNEIVEWVNILESTIDEASLVLKKHPWTWVSTEYTNKEKYTPKNADAFILVFEAQDTFSVKTDCNGIGGAYTALGNSLVLSNMMSTLMFCEDSDESIFTSMLSDVSTYSIGARNELILTNKAGDTSMIFE